VAWSRYNLAKRRRAISQPKINRDLCIQLPLWDDIKALVVRYRGRFPRKSTKQEKLDKIESLQAVIDSEWRTAEDLAEMAGISYHSAVKLLVPMIHEDKVIVRPQEWIDDRFRNRVRWLYRAKPEDNSLLLSILGTPRIPQIREGSAMIRVHICEDD
jgi:hypothetical protein